MRKNIVLSLIMTVCVVVLSFACVKSEATVQNKAFTPEKEVVNVACTKEANNALEARFLNMLNHSFVYNDDFYNDKVLANDSMLALLNVCEDGFIEQAVLSDYIFDMYGKIYKDYSFLGEGLPQKDGFVYVMPRDYEIYTHKLVSLTDNKDGSYTVMTDVEISYMDGSFETLSCETVFLENSESAFGCNIMYSIMSEGLVGDSQC